MLRAALVGSEGQTTPGARRRASPVTAGSPSHTYGPLASPWTFAHRSLGAYALIWRVGEEGVGAPPLGTSTDTDCRAPCRPAVELPSGSQWRGSRCLARASKATAPSFAPSVPGRLASTPVAAPLASAAAGGEAAEAGGLAAADVVLDPGVGPVPNLPLSTSGAAIFHVGTDHHIYYSWTTSTPPWSPATPRRNRPLRSFLDLAGAACPAVRW